MALTLDQPILGLGIDFPESLFVLYHPESGKYGCYYHDGVHGLACFSSESAACRFAELLDRLEGMETQHVTFDEAREIAIGRPLPVVSIMLVDQLDDPVIHYVR